jgi:TctA family transporter
MLLSRGDLKVFIERPISAAFLAICVFLLVGQLYVRWRKGRVVRMDAMAIEES